MTQKFYTSGLTAIGEGLIPWSTADLRVVLVDVAEYTFSATHQFLSDVASAARVAVTPTLTAIAGSGGVFDAQDAVFPSVTGDQSEALILYCHDGGADGARRLIAYDDEASNLPFTPDGSNVALVFNNGTAKVYRLINQT